MDWSEKHEWSLPLDALERAARHVHDASCRPSDHAHQTFTDPLKETRRSLLLGPCRHQQVIYSDGFAWLRSSTNNDVLMHVSDLLSSCFYLHWLTLANKTGCVAQKTRLDHFFHHNYWPKLTFVLKNSVSSFTETGNTVFWRCHSS